MSELRRIGVLSPLLGGFYFGGLLTGILKSAHEQRAQVVAIQTTDEWQPSSDAPPQLQLIPPAWDNVDGWVVIINAATTDQLRYMLDHRKPVVTLSITHPELGIPAILPDNIRGTASAVHHLIEHGHTRIAFIGCLEQEDIRQRYAGYQSALREHSIEPDPAWFFAASDQLQNGAIPAARQLIEAGMPCSAAVTGTDLNAMGVIETLHAAGYHIPNDLAIIGFDDVSEAEHTNPPLSSVRQRVEGLGRMAATQLFRQIEGDEIPDSITYVSTSLIRRQSCGCNSLANLASPSETMDLSGADWQGTLRRRLVEQLLFPGKPDPHLSPEQIWPGVASISAALEAILQGQPGPPVLELQEAWRQASERTLQSQMLHTIIRMLRRSGRRLLSQSGASQASFERFSTLLDNTHEHIAAARVHAEIQRHDELNQTIQYNYEVIYRIVESDPKYVRNLSWLEFTPVSAGCLGLWTDDPDKNPRAQLQVVGAYLPEGNAKALIGTRLDKASFPPEALFATSTAEQGSTIITVLPVKTSSRYWGYMALVGMIELSHITGRESSSQWASLLALALTRETLLTALEEKQRDLERQQTSLSLAYERERALASTVRELGSPIIPLQAGVLLVPLVGAIDTARAQQFIEDVLHGISNHNARVVLVDITGVPVVDTQVANSLLQATRAATLLGARVIMVGVRSEIAQTIVGIGINLSHIDTQPTLAKALQMLKQGY